MTLELNAMMLVCLLILTLLVSLSLYIIIRDDQSITLNLLASLYSLTTTATEGTSTNWLCVLIRSIQFPRTRTGPHCTGACTPRVHLVALVSDSDARFFTRQVVYSLIDVLIDHLGCLKERLK